MLPLALPLGVAVEPLGWDMLLEPPLAEPDELVSVDELELLLGAAVEPPEDVPLLSFSVSVVAAELDELDGLVVLADGLVVELDEELGELGLVALGEVELLELDPALGEPDGGVDGEVDELLLEPDGALDVLPRSSPHAARPRANATAIANVESLMCSSSGVRIKRRARFGPGVSP